MVVFVWEDCVRGLAGGAIIGLSMVFFMAMNGRVTGISGIVDNAFTFKPGDWLWRWVYLSGIIVAGLIVQYCGSTVLSSSLASMPTEGDWPVIVLSGLLVGLGCSLGNGCTSGHGLCGICRFSLRSVVNTATFFLVGIITATVTPFTPVAATLALAAATILAGVVVRFWTSYRNAPAVALPGTADAPKAVRQASIRDQASEWRLLVVSFVAAMIFGFGLAIAQMTNPNIVLHFLDLNADWDPTLGFVMFAGMVVCFIGFYFVFQRAQPVCSPDFQLPKEKRITLALVTGGVLFGVGWGLVGLCPGPGVFNLVQGDLSYYAWFLAQLGGIYLHWGIHRLAAHMGHTDLLNRSRSSLSLQPSSASLQGLQKIDIELLSAPPAK